MNIYIQKINAFNFPLLWLLSFRHEIYVLRLFLPQRLTSRFNLLKPYQLFSRDEWLLVQDSGFDIWKDTILPCLLNEPKCDVIYKGRAIDFSKNLWQWVGQEYENTNFFLSAVSRHMDKSGSGGVVISDFPHKEIRGMLVAKFTELRCVESRIFSACNLMHEASVSLAYLGAAALDFFTSFFSARLDSGRKKIFWAGISPAEIPSSDNKLSFLWPVQSGYSSADDTLFFLPVDPDMAQANYLKKFRTNYVRKTAVFSCIGLHVKIRLFFRILYLVVPDLFRSNNISNIMRSRYVSRALPWCELIELFQPKAHFTTTSSSWPEGPELAVLKAYGIKSIIWAYSANSIHYTTSDQNYRDLSLERSILIADEFWVWNAAFKRWLENRQVVDPVYQPKFLVKGPLMCGNIKNLLRPSAEVRKSIGLPREGFFIGVFDLPGVSEKWQNKYGGGPPMVTVEYSESFFCGIKRVLEVFPQVSIVLKLKRELGDSFRSYPEALLELIDPNGVWLKNNRLFLLEPSVDPFIPIAACDGAIGVPFTSPILAAIASGKNGIYFDGLSKVGYPSAPSLKLITVNNEQDLLLAVKSWLEGTDDSFSSLSDIVPPINHSPFLNYI